MIKAVQHVDSALQKDVRDSSSGKLLHLWLQSFSCFGTDLSLTTWLHVGPQCIRMGSIRTSGGWTWLQCSCTVTSAPVLLGTSSAGGGQGSPPHKHPAHTQTPSLCAFSSLCARMESVCSASLHTHQYFKDALTHSSLDETSLGRNLCVAPSLFHSATLTN